MSQRQMNLKNVNKLINGCQLPTNSWEFGNFPLKQKFSQSCVLEFWALTLCCSTVDSAEGLVDTECVHGYQNCTSIYMENYWNTLSTCLYIFILKFAMSTSKSWPCYLAKNALIDGTAVLKSNTNLFCYCVCKVWRNPAGSYVWCVWEENVLASEAWEDSDGSSVWCGRKRSELCQTVWNRNVTFGPVVVTVFSLEFTFVFYFIPIRMCFSITVWINNVKKKFSIH